MHSRHWLSLGLLRSFFYSVATEAKFRTKRGSSGSSNIVESENEDVSSGVVGDNNTSDSPSSSAPPPQSAFAAVSTKVAVKPTFSKCFTVFGLFVGLLALADFVADVLRFLDWKFFGRMAMAMNILLGVIFLPIWLLCLAKQLPEATDRFERE
eukprot:812299_1